MWRCAELLMLVAIMGVLPPGDCVSLPRDQAQRFRIRRQQRPASATFPIVSNFRLLEAMESLGRLIRALENKLSRHEFREAQVADFSTKTLNALNAQHSLMEKSLQTVAHQLANMEEKMLAVDALIQTTDERQRLLLSKLGEGLDRLLLRDPQLAGLPALPTAPPLGLPPEVVLSLTQTNAELERELGRLNNKVEQMGEQHFGVMSQTAEKVNAVSQSLSNHMGELSDKQDRLMQSLATCDAERLQSFSDVITGLTESGSNSCESMKAEVIGYLNTLVIGQRNGDAMLNELTQNTEEVAETVKSLDVILQELQTSNVLHNGSFAGLLDGLGGLEQASREHLSRLEDHLQHSLQENSQMLRHRMDGLNSDLNSQHTHVLDLLDDSASTAENIHNTIIENYEELSQDIQGLNKVEQVMINTADAVLDTKRSIEFGIQQVILELGDIVQNSGSTINSTLSDQINAISFNILKNQTNALTNMTSRMEQEISQVWRQIGIMYQQMETSVNMLDDLQNTTKQHMNASLNKVGNMDGTVGLINGKVADVEEDLNHLLGRLSLVVSEFHHMKSGISNELNRLREMTQEVSIPQVNGEGPQYIVNRKRLIPEPLLEEDSVV